MDLSADTLIRGRRCPGGARVTVAGEPLAPDTPLWETSLCLHNHSPGGPEWGYDGSGPAQLALTVLLLVTDSAEAVRYYYLFKNSVLAAIRADHWTLPLRDVQAWLDQAREGKPEMFTRLGRVGADGALCVALG